MTDSDREHTDDETEDLQEQEALEHTESTGEIDPSGAWPEGDPDTETPV